MINAALKIQSGVPAGAFRCVGTRARNLQYKRLVRFASARFLRVAAAAEAEVAEEPAQNVDASAAPAEGKQQRGGDNRGRRRTNNYRRPTIGPARTIELANLEIGKTYDGNVVSVTDFGAFVNIGCMTDGLLHISQISVEFVKNVADAVSVGAPVSVRVLSVDSERKKFSVTAIPEGQEPPPRRAQQGDRYDGGERQGGDGDRQSPPRQARQSKQSRRTSKAPCPVAPGDVVTGAVTSIAPFGVFVTLGEGYSGMLHRSQMKLPEGVQDHVGHITEGSEVEVRVVSINKGGEQIRLTQKTDDELAAEEETRVHGLSASIDVPEGSGPMAFMFAKAGINRDMFDTRTETANTAPVTEKTVEPEQKVEEKVDEMVVEDKKEAEPAHAAPSAPAAESSASGGISASLVKELRESSGAGMMDCKKALAECNGNIEEAKDYLRKKGLASADKKAGRVAAEGAVWSYIHAGSRLGVLVEVNCETDFVARGEKFQELVNDIAMQIAACPQVTVVSASEVPAEVLERERAIEMEKEDLKSKPEAIREKIVQGRVDKIAKELALLEQPFVKDTNKTVAEIVKESVASIGENIQIRRFRRFTLGEGIEVAPKGDFAAEVEAQTSAMAAKAAEKKAEEKPATAGDGAAAPAVAVSAVSAALVKQLREASGAGMMDCKKALAECGGDIEAAKDYLRKKGLASADKKAGRVASEGAIGAYIHAGSRLGVLVEVNCETDFVARGEKFRELVNDLAMQIAACPDVRFVSASDVPAEVLERERAIEMEKEDLKSKPEAIREKIVQGRVDKIAKEFALMEQQYIKDTNKTVAEHIKEQIAAIGENMQVRRFERFVLGEGLEKKVTDFAAEVAAQTGGKL